MDFQVVWSEPAVAELEAIVRYIGQDSPASAETVRAEMLEHVEMLARFPFIGPVYERDRSGRTREILCRMYRVFYRVIERNRRVEILTIWHGARMDPVLPG